ncbi:MAG: hypothetical protein NXI20_18595 [bacterium]|nr:hypothetical protein [bacterium]
MKKTNKSLWAILIATFIIANINSCSKQILNHSSPVENSDTYAVE